MHPLSSLADRRVLKTLCLCLGSDARPRGGTHVACHKSGCSRLLFSVSLLRPPPPFYIDTRVPSIFLTEVGQSTPHYRQLPAPPLHELAHSSFHSICPPALWLIPSYAAVTNTLFQTLYTNQATTIVLVDISSCAGINMSSCHASAHAFYYSQTLPAHYPLYSALASTPA